MTKLWWAQIKAVIRMEVKKTLFARRGLWIYILALLPLFLFAVHAVIISRERDRSMELAKRSDKRASHQDLSAVKEGMTSEELTTLLGKPPQYFRWNERRPIPPVSAAIGTGGSGTPVNLSSAYNLTAIFTDETTHAGGLDDIGSAYSSKLLTANRILNGVQFNFGPPDQPDAVHGAGHPIGLPQGKFTTLQLLATGINGPVLSQTLTVTYADGSTGTFTQNFSDWCSCSPGPGRQPGETFAVAMPYRDSSDGQQDNREFYLYGYTFLLNANKTVQSLTLPDNRNVAVLAATLSTQSPAPQAVATEQAGFVNVVHESYHYSDGANDLFVTLADGKVTRVRLDEGYNLTNDSLVFAGVFQFFYLRLAIFFGCLGIFMNLFRGEILDKSLHFYFLAPIRRDVLMVGKFLAGLLATCIIFVTSEVLQIVVFIWPLSPNVRDLYLYQNHGLAHAAAYVGVTALACLGYGAFFLAAGMLFKNPILPAAAILIWEGVNPFLPALLKKVSVIYYLKSLCPVDIPSPPGTPALLSLLVSNPDPVSAPVAILGIMTVALLVLYVSSFQVRRMEINYTAE
ncbi:MAG TPA: ABC transporter permease [Candidatus Sulfotelmatobacter sp.]